MGGGSSKEEEPESSGLFPKVPPDSPLGRMFAGWGYGRTKGKQKKRMVEYCKSWSKQPIKGSSVWWPPFGSDEDWVRQALNIYVNSKPNVREEENEYASCWVPGPGDSARSFKLETKTKEEEPPWEVLNHLPPPYVPRPQQPEQAASAPHPDDPQRQAEEEREKEEEEWEEEEEKRDEERKEWIDRDRKREEEGKDPPRSRLPKMKTRSGAKKGSQKKEEGEAKLCPLREVPMSGPNGGTGYVNVPLTSTEVRTFKKEMKNLLEDPMGLAEQLDQFLGPNIYTWDEMYSIMGTLFSTQERQMIRQAAIVMWEKEKGNAGEPKFPLLNPNWDKQTGEGQGNMRDMREFLIKGIRQAVPKGHNFTKAFGSHQNPDETPTDFLDRIRKNMQQYAGVDPETEVGQQLIRVEFVSKAWPDIRKKLEKIEDWNSKPLSELLREAQKVFVRRDEEKQKKTARIMVQTVRQVTTENREKRGTWSDRGNGQEPGRKTRRTLRCFHCNEEGHFKRECPKYRREVRSYAMMEDED